MKHTDTPTRSERTRQSICRALADVISTSPTGEFSVQEVADRAGVTHRTVYNHFPNRQSLVDGLNAYLEELSSPDNGLANPEEIEAALTADGLPALIPRLYARAAHDEALSRAVAMVSLTAPRLSEVTRERTERFESTLGEDLPGAAQDELQLLAVAVRMFASHTGWHLLTGPYGLTQDQAERLATWATRALIDAYRSDDIPEPPRQERTP